MSRIGKKPVPIPAGVKVSAAGGVVKVEGPKGSLTLNHRPEIRVAVDGASVQVSVDERRAGEKQVRASWGTTRALVDNMIEGVTKGFEKKMEIVGVGWQASVSGKTLKMSLGFADPVELTIPDNVKVAVDKAIVTLTSADKQAVGQFAALMRSKRKPEPYNGKGVKYANEVIKKKEGKAFGK